MDEVYFAVGDKRESTPQLWSTAAAGYIWPSDPGFQAWVVSGHQPTALPDHAALQAELARRASLAEAAAKAWADGAEARAHAAAVERARRVTTI
jgi:hypothetical protein